MGGVSCTLHLHHSQAQSKYHIHVAVTGRKRSTVSGLIRLVISLECFIEITPDFLCKFQSHSYSQSLVIAV